jgi:hypothetical protein
VPSPADRIDSSLSGTVVKVPASGLMSALVIVALGAEVALAMVVAPAMGEMASAATASAATAAGLATRESRCLVELSTFRLCLGSPGSHRGECDERGDHLARRYKIHTMRTCLIAQRVRFGLIHRFGAGGNTA